MIYIINCDIFNSDDKYFFDMTDEEIVELAKRDPLLVDIYNDINELADAWNSDYVFYPSNSYMRVINN